MKINSICVYCGSSPGRLPDYTSAARELGEEIGRRGIRLVYGGAGVGLMGEVARATLAAGGLVVGVMPEALFVRELASTDGIELRVVKDMHERKTVMAELSDGFIALPGGFGTFEEFFEALTWQQLGIHTKPCGLLNIHGYFDDLLKFLEHAVSEMFIHKPHLDMILSSNTPADLIEKFLDYVPVKMDKAHWVKEMSGHRPLD
ncbi:MAG: TIGR00730 family Rossman fold protein [Chloroflexi bacterium]|nr:TIGR00730 family Rossman fold protein [Chloroflexota bacterium]